ncbi:unnamed protein product, partial [Gulo gulo]
TRSEGQTPRCGRKFLWDQVPWDRGARPAPLAPMHAGGGKPIPTVRQQGLTCKMQGDSSSALLDLLDWEVLLPLPTRFLPLTPVPDFSRELQVYFEVIIR